MAKTATPSTTANTLNTPYVPGQPTTAANVVWCEHCKVTGHRIANCHKAISARARAIADAGVSNVIKNNAAKTCHHCKATDHLIADCPQRCRVCHKFGHGHPQCPQLGCRYCHDPDHQVEECPCRCLECGRIGRHHEDCTSFCKYCKSNKHNIAGCPKRCYECGEFGHRAAQCPKRPLPRCNKCKQEGHVNRDCPKHICKECNENGHIQANCPYLASEGLQQFVGGSDFRP